MASTKGTVSFLDAANARIDSDRCGQNASVVTSCAVYRNVASGGFIAASPANQ